MSISIERLKAAEQARQARNAGNNALMDSLVCARRAVERLCRLGASIIEVRLGGHRPRIWIDPLTVPDTVRDQAVPAARRPLNGAIQYVTATNIEGCQVMWQSEVPVRSRQS